MTANNEGDSPKQRVATCHSIWKNKNKEETKMPEEKDNAFLKNAHPEGCITSSKPEIEYDPGYKKPKSYVETLEDEVHKGIPERTVFGSI